MALNASRWFLAVTQQGGGHEGTCAPPPYRMSRGPIQPAFFTFFPQSFAKNTFFYQICQMKWPKSEEKIEMGGGGLEKLGGLRMVCPPAASMFGCATGF